MWLFDTAFRMIARTRRTSSLYTRAFLELVPTLGNCPNFFLAGLVNSTAQSIYVHSKTMVVDDKWWTVGSANCVDLSFNRDHTELNISIWDAPSALLLRRRLFAEHLGQIFEGESNLTEFDWFVDIACKNTTRILAGEFPLPGTHAVALNPKVYGTSLYAVSLYLEHWYGC